MEDRRAQTLSLVRDKLLTAREKKVDEIMDRASLLRDPIINRTGASKTGRDNVAEIGKERFRYQFGDLVVRDRLGRRYVAIRRLRLWPHEVDAEILRLNRGKGDRLLRRAPSGSSTTTRKFTPSSLACSVFTGGWSGLRIAYVMARMVTGWSNVY